MKIEANSVVSIHYTLTGEDGEVIDSSADAEPLVYLAGAGNIIPGLDTALLSLQVGDKKQVTVAPEEGYGVHDEELVQKLPRDMFGGVESIEVGMSFQANDASGQVRFVEVVKVEDDGITIDGNHALAGKVLNFDISIEDVREATESEIAQGHAH